MLPVYDSAVISLASTARYRPLVPMVPLACSRNWSALTFKTAPALKIDPDSDTTLTAPALTAPMVTVPKAANRTLPPAVPTVDPSAIVSAPPCAFNETLPPVVVTSASAPKVIAPPAFSVT